MCYLFVVKKMFHPSRALATVLYLSTLFLTLFIAFFEDMPARSFLLVLCIITQFLAMIWYTLSYIPYARTAIKSWCLDTCCRCGFRGGWY